MSSSAGMNKKQWIAAMYDNDWQPADGAENALNPARLWINTITGKRFNGEHVDIVEGESIPVWQKLAQAGQTPMVGKLETCPIFQTEAFKFIDQYHRHCKAPVGSIFQTAAMYNGVLVSVVIVGRPTARFMQDGFTCEVTRLCSHDTAPKNTESFLYAKARQAAKALGWKKIITYNLQSESGESLRGAGYKIDKICPPNEGGWSVPSRPRDFQEVYAQPKFRWAG